MCSSPKCLCLGATQGSPPPLQDVHFASFLSSLPLATLVTANLGFRVSKKGSISVLELMVVWATDCVQ